MALPLLSSPWIELVSDKSKVSSRDHCRSDPVRVQSTPWKGSQWNTPKTLYKVMPPCKRRSPMHGRFVAGPMPRHCQLRSSAEFWARLRFTAPPPQGEPQFENRPDWGAWRAPPSGTGVHATVAGRLHRKRAWQSEKGVHPDSNQGPADLESAALTN